MSSDKRDDSLGRLIPHVMQVVRGATSLAAQDINFYKSIDKNISDEIGISQEKLHEVAEQLLQSSSEGFDGQDVLKESLESDIGWKKISNVLDNVFEKIDKAFDEATSTGKKKETSEYMYIKDAEADTGGQYGPSTKRIVKPQLNFENKVDNSESGPFKPKLTSKPHSLISFEESTKLINPEQDDNSDDVDPPHYAQPYEYEIDHQPYPESILSKSEPIPSEQWEGTEAIWVDTPELLSSMIQELKTSTEIAVDLEHHDYRTYYGLVCLMQISNRSQDWIVDTLALRDQLEPLNEVFTNPNVIKVFHGAFMDIIWLQRDLGLYIVSLFDTYHASKKLGFPKFSLAYLLETFAHFKTSKKYQLSDWRVRPLSPPMLAYARSDTHFLLNIFDQLKNKLIEQGSDKISEVLYESRQVAKRRFEFTKYRPLSTSGGKVSCPVMSNNPKEPYSSLMAQYNIPGHKKAMVEVLYMWRDKMAKQDDESVRYVMPNQLLVNLANLESPIDPVKVLNVPSYIPEHVRLHAKEIADLLENTLKQIAENDWALAERWDLSHDQDIIGFEDDEKNLEAIAGDSMNIMSKAKYSSLPTSHDLITPKSLIFSSKAVSNFAIEYDVKEKKVNRFDLNERIAARLDFSIKEFQKLENKNIITLVDNSHEETSEHENTKQNEVIPSRTESDNATKQEAEDPNEIIVLRKKQLNNKNKTNSVNKESQSAPAVNYEEADKLMLDVQNNKKTKRKKTFDPYSRENNGPAPAKRARKQTDGRTMTYSQKR